MDGGSSVTNWIEFNEHLNNTIQAMSSEFFVKPVPINLAQTSQMKNIFAPVNILNFRDLTEIHSLNEQNKICNLNVTKSFL